MNSPFFHAVTVKSDREVALDQNSRTFVVKTQTPYLEVPGLLEVNRVIVGTTEIPLEIQEKVSTNADATEHEIQTVPMIALDKLPNGTPVLLRGIKSNNGMWQPGLVHVSGTWQTEEVAPDPEAK